MPLVQTKPFHNFFRKIKPFKKSPLNDINASRDMGQFSSGLKKKEEHVTETPNDKVTTPKIRSDQLMAKYAQLLKERGVIPDIFLVKESQSSKFVDEDGDVANEFLTEKLIGPRRRLCRVIDNIKPKGKEKYAIPRLSPDLPVVMWELKSS